MSKTVNELNTIVAGLSGIRSAVEQIQRECQPGSPAWYTFSGLLNEITKVAQGAANVAAELSSAPAAVSSGNVSVQRTVSAPAAKKKLKKRVASKQAAVRAPAANDGVSRLLTELLGQPPEDAMKRAVTQTLSLQELLSMLSSGGGMFVEIGPVPAQTVKEGQNSCCDAVAS